MTLRTYTQAPYNDDFDETKNYLRMLFRPGHAVQGRELTQLQTVLQNQVARFGEHVFKDGTRVIGGDPTFDTNVHYAKITVTTGAFATIVAGNVVTGAGTGVAAKVITTTAAAGSDPDTIYIQYTASGSAGAKLFIADEVLAITGGVAATIGAAATTPIGKASTYDILPGIYFVNGNFVHSGAQTVVVGKYSNVPTIKVVLAITEAVITIAEDATLGDNATNSPNEAAPGAHRYNITLVLKTQPVDEASRTENKFIQLAHIENGALLSEARGTEYNELLKILATRTFEESGNYTLRPFQISMRDHPSDAAKLQTVLEPSVAYVNGTRIETISPTYIDIDRSRSAADISAVGNSATPILYGNYVTTTAMSGNINHVLSLVPVELHNAANNANIGSARIRNMEYTGVSGVYNLYLFDIKMNAGQLKSDIGFIKHSGTFPFLATLGANAGILNDSGNNIALFPLAYSNIESIDVNTTTTYLSKTFTGTGSAGTSVSFSTSGANELFTNKAAAVLCNTATGDIVNYTSAFTGGNQGITFSDGNVAAATYILYIDVAVQAAVATPKTKSMVVDSSLTIASPNLVAGSHDSLSKTDIYQLKSVTMGGQDITERYSLDNGQRDNFYDLGRIRLKYGAPAPTAGITIVFDYFSHGAGDFFTVASYAGISEITWNQIPSYESSKGIFSLHDVIDFRPTINAAGTTFVSPGSVAAPGQITIMDFNIYLARKDKLFLKDTGEFGVVRGESAIDPKSPQSNEDSMTLYELDIAPYTGVLSDVRPRVINNRRYTMSDIGKLDKRVKNLEYYTTLSLLEQSVLSASTLDAAGAERFKNGFVVDNFNGHSVGDVTNTDYKIAMDIQEGILRPHFHQDALSLKIDAASTLTGIKQHGTTITLPYDTSITTAGRSDLTGMVASITQPYASGVENLMPYLVFDYAGNLKLSPATDDWVDTETRPQVVINETGVYDAMKFLADATGVLGTEWNGWQTTWTGTDTNRQTTTSRRGRGRNGDQITTSTTTTNTTTSRQTNTGIRTSIGHETVEKNLGDKVVNINFIPFMRSRKVFFYANRLKPSTTMYLYFDGIDLTAYAKNETSSTYATWIAAQADGSNADTSYKGFTTHPGTTSALVTSAAGEVWGSFIVPSNATHIFKTGQREVKITDDSANNSEFESSTASNSYAAQGLLKAVEGTVISTKVPTFEETEISQDRTIVTVDRSTGRTRRAGVDAGGGKDPLAQTFIINELGGAFITVIDAFFKTKSATTTSVVLAQIRTVVNGYPTAEIIAEASLTSASVNVSATAATATPFTFTDPVYLKGGIEYALVLKADNTEYEAWVSELGKFDVANASYRIAKQPALGVLFKSANGTAWQSDQFKDLKFTIYRAAFDTSATGLVTLVNKEVPAKLLGKDPIEAVNTKTDVRVSHRNHGMNIGDTVSITGATATGGLTINGDHVISKVEPDFYVIVPGSAATSTATGGGIVVNATENRKFELMQTQIQSVVLPTTGITWEKKSSSETASPYNPASAYIGLLENTNLVETTPQVIPHSNNQPAGTARSFYLKGVMTSTNANLSPVLDKERMSIITVNNRINLPIDEASYSVGVNDRVYKELDGTTVRYIDELNSSDNSALSRYMTRKITFEQSANGFKAWMVVNRPLGTNIDLYYRVDEEDTLIFNEQPWIRAYPLGGAPLANDDASLFTEIEYDFENGVAAQDVSGLAAGDSFASVFSAIQLKIVLTSNNSAKVPQIKEFRTIALFG